MTINPDRLPLLVAAPPVALAVVSVLLIGLGRLGANPFWQPSDLTVSEAAGLRDQAAVLVWVAKGADLNRAYPIRSGLIGEHELVLTPMEAAIHEDRADMAALLVTSGVNATPERVCEWLILAADGKPEVAAYLRDRYPADSARCSNEPAAGR